MTKTNDPRVIIRTTFTIEGEDTTFVIRKVPAPRAPEAYEVFVDGGDMPNGEASERFDLLTDAMDRVTYIVEQLRNEAW